MRGARKALLLGVAGVVGVGGVLLVFWRAPSGLDARDLLRLERAAIEAERVLLARIEAGAGDEVLEIADVELARRAYRRAEMEARLRVEALAAARLPEGWDLASAQREWENLSPFEGAALWLDGFIAASPLSVPAGLSLNELPDLGRDKIAEDDLDELVKLVRLFVPPPVWTDEAKALYDAMGRSLLEWPFDWGMGLVSVPADVLRLHWLGPYQRNHLRGGGAMAMFAAARGDWARHRQLARAMLLVGCARETWSWGSPFESVAMSMALSVVEVVLPGTGAPSDVMPTPESLALLGGDVLAFSPDTRGAFEWTRAVARERARLDVIKWQLGLQEHPAQGWEVTRSAWVDQHVVSRSHQSVAATVHEVDTLFELAWQTVKGPPASRANARSELEDRTKLFVDYESTLAEIGPALRAIKAHAARNTMRDEAGLALSAGLMEFMFARRARTLARLAIERHRIVHGELPTTLEEAVLAFGAAIAEMDASFAQLYDTLPLLTMDDLADPYAPGGEAIRYAIRPDVPGGYVLYGVGINGRDDGGAFTNRSLSETLDVVLHPHFDDLPAPRP